MSIVRKLSFLLLVLPLSLQACKKDQNNAFYNLFKTQRSSKYYYVKAGDTLINISAKYGCHYQEIARWNNLKPPYNIIVGQKLKLFKHYLSPLNPLNKTTVVTPPSVPVSTVISVQKSQKSIPNQSLQNLIFKTYKVKKGDTLYSISRYFGLDHKLIAVANNLLTPEQLNAGRELKIPDTKQKHSTLNFIKNQLTSPQNLRFNSQKKLIISNNNENMLKFYCQWPINGKLLKTFAETGHRGIEISGHKGQKVRAVATGKVVAVNASIYGHGKFVVIKHNNRYMSSYANNQRTLVKPGQKVTQGQIIAELGAIGDKPPLLKFEIRKSGKLINPMYFLPKR